MTQFQSQYSMRLQQSAQNPKSSDQSNSRKKGFIFGLQFQVTPAYHGDCVMAQVFEHLVPVDWKVMKTSETGASVEEVYYWDDFEVSKAAETIHS